MTLFGCLLIGGGCKGLVSSYLRGRRQRYRPIREHTPVRST